MVSSFCFLPLAAVRGLTGESLVAKLDIYVVTVNDIAKVYEWLISVRCQVVHFNVSEHRSLPRGSIFQFSIKYKEPPQPRRNYKHSRRGSKYSATCEQCHDPHICAEPR